MPYCEISDRRQMSKTRESLESAVTAFYLQ